MSVNSEFHNAYNLCINKNTITIAPTGNFTKETNGFYYTEQRKNSSAEKTYKYITYHNTYISQYACLYCYIYIYTCIKYTLLYWCILYIQFIYIYLKNYLKITKSTFLGKKKWKRPADYLGSGGIPPVAPLSHYTGSYIQWRWSVYIISVMACAQVHEFQLYIYYIIYICIYIYIYQLCMLF